MNRLACAVLTASAIGLGSLSAMAQSTVTATLSANYFEVANNGSDPDFQIFSTPIVAPGSMLGPNGFPVGTGVNDINPATGEITWWSPALNSHVVSTGTGTISLPYNSNMYAPNSTGGNDSGFFETAYFTGNFTLPGMQDVMFQLGSDDDSFIYVDGSLIGQNPGVHGVTNVNFTAAGLSAGNHTIEVFYDDRHTTGAVLSLNLLTNNVIIIPPPVPEPASLALFGLAFAGLAAVRARTRT